MKKVLCAILVLGLAAVPATRATTITENFTTNPYQDGWQLFGNTNLFYWDSTNHQLDVTWDSTQTNSYFYYPLNDYLSRSDDFSLEFDLVLNDIASGVETGKTGPLELGFGFLHQSDALSTNFMRGAYGSAPNVAEFNYYTYGYYNFGGTIYPSPNTAAPGFISGTGLDYAPEDLSAYEVGLPTNETVHVQFTFTGYNQTAVLVLTTNGVPLAQLPPLLLPDGGFANTDNYQVDMISISSYSSFGDAYDSVLAHGSVAHLAITTQINPVGALSGALTNNAWQVQFFSRTNWTYVLQRSTDLVSWTNLGPATPGNGSLLLLEDSNPPPASACYRVSARQP